MLNMKDKSRIQDWGLKENIKMNNFPFHYAFQNLYATIYTTEQFYEIGRYYGKRRQRF